MISGSRQAGERERERAGVRVARRAGLVALCSLLLVKPSAAQPTGDAVATGDVVATGDAVSPSAIDDTTRAAVRRLGNAGVAACRAGDYAAASEKLEKAFQLMPVPSLALWSARALVGLGAWTRAAERYLSARRLELGPGDARIQLDAREQAARERAELMRRIPTLKVRLSGATPGEIEVSVDDRVLPALLLGEDWPMDPGSHRIVGHRGEERVEAEQILREGEHAELTLRFTEQEPLVPPAAPAQSAPLPLKPAPASDGFIRDTRATGPTAWRTVGWVSLGVGGAALLSSGVIGLLASARHRELQGKPDCAGNQCLATIGRDVRAYNRLVDYSTAGWITGAALGGAGALLLLVLPGSENPVNVALSVDGVSCMGRF